MCDEVAFETASLQVSRPKRSRAFDLHLILATRQCLGTSNVIEEPRPKLHMGYLKRGTIGLFRRDWAV